MVKLEQRLYGLIRRAVRAELQARFGELRPHLSVAEVAKLAGISADQVYRLAEAGEIEHVRPTPGRIVFHPVAVKRWLESRTVREAS